MTRLLSGINGILKVAMTALFALLLVPVVLQILARYTELIPRYIWTEEIARFCFIWIIMLGAMIAVREETHFSVDLLPQPKTVAGQGWGQLVVHIAMLGLALSFIWYGREFANEGLLQTSEIADLPMIAIYIAWPLSGLIWTLFLAEKISHDISLIRRGGEPITDPLAAPGADTTDAAVKDPSLSRSA
ncbi:MAG: TRAP transporter small permease [Burkholderiaceae bacterium]